MKKITLVSLFIGILIPVITIYSCSKGGGTTPPSNPCAGVTVNVTGTLYLTNGIFNLTSAGTWILRYDLDTDGTGVASPTTQFAITDCNTIAKDSCN